MTIKTNKIYPRDGLPTYVRGTTGSGGGVIQTVSFPFTGTTQLGGGTLATGTYYDTGLTATITPQSASSKIFVMGHISHNCCNSQQLFLFLNRGGTIVTAANGDTDGARRSCWVSGQSNQADYSDWAVVTTPFHYLDSPNTTSSTVYKVQALTATTTTDIYINRSDADRASTYYDSRAMSNITLMEVCG